MNPKHLFPTLLAALLLSACGDDPEPAPQQPSHEEQAADDTERTSYENLILDDSIATSSNPAKSWAGQAAMVQTSLPVAYQDPDGSTFRVEPKANVRFLINTDTVRAEDIAALTKVVQLKNETSNTANGETTTYATDQRFSVGTQEVCFGMSYEAVRHINSRQHAVDLPYLRLTSARQGKTPSATETTRATYEPIPVSVSTAVTAIRLQPRPTTRGVITTEQAYDVTVAFTVDLQTVDAGAVSATRSLAFEANYIGIVSTTTEYPDPETSFAYKLTPLSGTTDVHSPFTLAPGAFAMTVNVEQTATYSWFDTEAMEQKAQQIMPHAEVAIALSADTAYADVESEFTQVTTGEPLIASEGENPMVYQAERSYEIGGGQKVTFKWQYDAYGSITVEENEVALPYIELGVPELMSVTKTERPDIPIPNGGEGMVYEVTLRFTQNVASQNAVNNTAETVEYIVKYMAVKQVKLVKVVYRKEIVWSEPHDNLLLGYHAYVYRDRVYSDGKTFTDTFINIGYFADSIPYPAIVYDTIFAWDGKIVTYSIPYEVYSNSGASYIGSCSTGVPNLSYVQPFTLWFDHHEYPAGDWSQYEQRKTYEGMDVPLADVEVIGADSTTTLPSGWYHTRTARDFGYQAEYIVPDAPFDWIGGGINVVMMRLTMSLPDQFLVMDGQMIHFLEMREPEEVSATTEDITMPNGAPARIFKLEYKQHFAGRDLYAAAIDTVYQFEPTPQFAPQVVRHSTPQAARLSAPQATRHSAPRPAQSSPRSLLSPSPSALAGKHPELPQPPQIIGVGKTTYGAQYTEMEKPY